MLFFLRNIRRKLISNNKVITYLLYAIGEIVLVVAGILIAVQIDDWNEEKKSNKKSHEYLLRINEDINLALNDIEGSISLTNRRLLTSIVTKQSLESNNFNDSIKPYFEYYLKSYYKYALSIQEINSFKEMMNSGEIQLIKNEWLRNELSNLTSQSEFILEANKHSQEASSNLDDYFEFYVRYYTINNSTDSIKTAIEYDFNKMAKDGTLINKISKQIQSRIDMMRFFKNYQRRILRIRDTVKREITYNTNQLK